MTAGLSLAGPLRDWYVVYDDVGDPKLKCRLTNTPEFLALYERELKRARVERTGFVTAKQPLAPP